MDNSPRSKGDENDWGALWKREMEGGSILKFEHGKVGKFGLYKTRTIN